MNIEKFTNKSKEALLASQTIAQEYQNAELLNLHLLLALLRQSDGLTPSIVEKLGLSCKLFEQKVADELIKLPKVSGAVELYQSKEFASMIQKASPKVWKCCMMLSTIMKMIVPMVLNSTCTRPVRRESLWDLPTKQ